MRRRPSSQKARTAGKSVPFQRPAGICSYGYIGFPTEDETKKQVCSRDDRPLYKMNESDNNGKNSNTTIARLFFSSTGSQITEFRPSSSPTMNLSLYQIILWNFVALFGLIALPPLSTIHKPTPRRIVSTRLFRVWGITCPNTRRTGTLTRCLLPTPTTSRRTGSSRCRPPAWSLCELQLVRPQYRKDVVS